MCTLLKVKKSWLYDEVERGVRCDPPRQALRFRPSDLVRFLDTNRR
jgi:hypothetical protein